MPQRHGRRDKICKTATASTPEGELQRHLKDLGLESVEAYRAWCREYGFGGGLHKGWQERREEHAVALRLRAESDARSGLLQHAQALGFSTYGDYAAWCAQHGFSTALHKGPALRKQEQAARERERAQAALTQSRRPNRRPDILICALHAGEPLPDDLRTPYLHKIQELFASIEGKQELRDAFLRLLLHAQKQARLFSLDPVIERFGAQPGNTFLDGLLALTHHHDAWLQPPETWRPDTHNARAQFGALARHLLAKYFVPVFMDAAWFQGDPNCAYRQQMWFRHIGIGQNIRTADVPLHLTKMAAHHFLSAPRDFTIEGALRWGQIYGLGGNEYLVRVVVATRLGETFEHEEFWEGVLHFFVNNPMLDGASIGPIIDYVHQQKFVPRPFVAPDGNEALGLPAEPDFTMKGRTVPALMRRVEAWHRQLARETRKPAKLQWEPSGIGGFELRERDEDTGSMVRWSIEELLGSAELIEEGKAMHHCVASYAASCARGQISIWSMQMEGVKTKVCRRVMTIEVQNARRLVAQARGKCNKQPGDKRASPRLDRAPEILKRWAEQERLTLPSYI